MGVKNDHQGKRSNFSIESAIVIGFSLKLILTAAFLLFFQDSPALPLPQAFAQEKIDPKAAQTKEATDPKKAADAGTPATEAKPDTGGMTPAELLEWERRLRTREEKIKTREKALDALEKGIQERMAGIEKTRQQLADLVQRNEDLVKEQKDLQQGRIEHLVSAYKGMRPEAAGALVNNLDDDVAVAILSAMPGRNAGLILANVDPKKAARLTKAISESKTVAPPAEGN